MAEPLPDPAAREAAVVRLLDGWPWQHGAVIVGGYAVSAYGSPRYSDDLDLVLPKGGMAPTVAWLQSLRPPFAQAKIGPAWQQNYGGTVSRFERSGETLDLLPVAVRDREALVDVPYEWIAREARRIRLVLLDAATSASVPVARPEALWLLKLQSGRPQDLSDLFAIHQVPVALRDVREGFDVLSSDALTAKLNKVLDRLQERKQYEDSLSRWGRGSPEAPSNRKAWATFLGMVESAMPRAVKRARPSGADVERAFRASWAKHKEAYKRLKDV